MRKRAAGHSWRHGTWGLCVLACVTVAFHASTWGAESAGKEKKKTSGPAFEASKKERILITAERMEVDGKKSSITYRGQVVAVQGEMTMKSDTLTALYTADMAQLKEVTAEGRVHVTQGNRVATGEKAVFNGQDQTVALIGKAVVRQGKSVVSGPRIIFYIDKDLVIAEGGVQTTIFPDELKQQEKNVEGASKGP